MSALQRLAILVVSLVMALAVAGLSQVPVNSDTDRALIRLSWRAEPVRAEECRTLTAEEQADVPVHMRRAQECVGGFVDYELTLRIDDRVAIVDTIAPAGLRRDRPVYVLREVPVEAGRHAVEVEFTALVPPSLEEREGLLVEREWTGEMDLEPREVGLVTLDPTNATLERRMRPGI